MNYLKISKILSLAALVLGGLTAIGWIFGIGFLTSNIIPGTINTKFITSLSFVFASIALFTLVYTEKNRLDSAPLILLTCSFIMLFFMATTIYSQLSGVNTGVEQLFVREAAGAAATTVAGAPAISTAINFVMISIACILSIINPIWLRRSYLILGGAVFVIGTVAVIGYALGVPVMYYTLGSWTNPIALKTAFIFSLLGAGLALLGKKE